MTLALGALVLGILRDYYGGQERNYLRSNAYAISSLVTDMIQQDPSPTALQTQIESLTFLAQSRIRVLDPYHNVMADSGSFNNVSIVMVTDGNINQILQITLPNDSTSGEARADKREVNVFLEHEVFTDVMGGNSPHIPLLTGAQSNTLWLSSMEPISDTSATGAILAVRTLYGFDLSAEAGQPEQRSNVTISKQQSSVTVQAPVWQADGTLWGYVELSEGPAYGTQIVYSAARAWGIAGIIAILLAAGIGWVMSRNLSAPLVALTQATAQMASGDLSTRAPASERLDELGTLARTFNQMAVQVEETVVTLRQFVSDAAHELHTPLTALRTNLELANDAVAGTDAISRAQTQVTRLESLTEGLLDLSHVEAGERTLMPVDLTALVHEIAEIYASQAEQSEITFTLDVPDEALSIRGDATQLRRIVTNLLDNALKFTPAGGQATLTLHKTEAQACLTVQDTGIGIPEEDLSHLFQRFHRGHNTADYPGSGLGLAIVRAIVERHGGTVRAEQQADGARFSVYLPIEST
ncbi:MAG: HAMP domain-containing histidine kinase [Anaerolineae bacterium]|nr:HAMP domain-containing histidine kinase [Anaerolineae bacterium]